VSFAQCRYRSGNDRSLTTQGDATNPTGRIYPRRIIPWTTFPTRQEEGWHQLSFSPSFSSQAAFPSQHQLEYVKSLLHPVSSELGLRSSQRDAVENAVQKLVDETHNDPSLRSHLGIHGTITFESHTNLGNADESLPESMEQLSIGTDGSEAATTQRPRPPKAASHRRRARGKGNRADQFCIYRTSDDRSIPIVAIEYKPPHKLSRDEVVSGLGSEIQPDRDIINKDGDGFAFAAKRLTTAVVTQLFSYMVGKGIQYGYVCTGETYVFLHISDDPSCVYYSVCIPSLDVQDDDETRLHRTAVAQVFAFFLQAIRSPLPSQAWHSAVENLDTWCVEYDDVLRSIPETERKEKKRATPYKPQRWKGFARSPIRTRSRCLPAEGGAQPPSSDDENDRGESPSPTLDRTTRRRELSVNPKDTRSGETQDRGGDQQENSTRQSIQARPYCTHQCLRGLAFGGPMDKECPNVRDHGNAHIDQKRFLDLIRSQLALDRGPGADCVPLHLSGSRGSLFKVRLSSRGYTLVAKGVEGMDAALLRHENGVYDCIRALQGEYVPVCLGSVDLIEPYYFDSGVFQHFLFMSYAGRPVFKSVQVNAGMANEIVTAFTALHKRHILHCDPELRNVLYDARISRCMIVDFERASIHTRPPLGPISPSSQNRKRKRTLEKGKKDIFTREVQSLQMSLLRCVSAEGRWRG
jgi:hypothetical protein